MTPKGYFRLFVLALIIAPTTWALIATKAAKNSREDAQRYYENMLGATFEIQKLETKLGETQYRVKGLTVERDEFVQLNDSLAQRVKDLGVKLKKAEMVVRLEVRYEVDLDTLYLDTLAKPKAFGYVDNWVNVKGFFNETDWFKIDSLHFALKDDIIIVPVVEGKWWQCRKKWKIAVRIQSKSPYNSIDRIEYYKFKKE